MAKIEIFTDGASSDNQSATKRFGGWGVILVVSDSNNIERLKIQQLGHEDKAAVGKMELTGLVEALELLEKYEQKYSVPKNPVSIKSDSEYIVKGFNEYLPKWSNNGWVKTNKKPVEYKEMWQKVIEIRARIKTEFTLTYIPTESNPADQLAKKAVEIGKAQVNKAA